jgi:hypothetical protein
MGLRFSILGFAQERVINVRAKVGERELRLDITDLLLLNQIADFPNRNHVMKIINNDKIFFWMSYSEILEELPILNLKKQALRDRFDKLVALGLLEKTTNKTSNMTFFRLTDLYESMRYDMLTYGGDNDSVFNDRGVYSTTQGVCSELHTITEYNNNNINKEKDKDKEKENVCDLDIVMPTPAEHTNSTECPAIPTAEEFEDLWLMYERKGCKQKAKKEFAKLKEEEIATMRLHIPAYIQSRPDKQYRQDFERYIKHKTFNSVVYGKTNVVLFDPDEPNVSVTQAVLPEKIEQNETYTINGVTYR